MIVSSPSLWVIVHLNVTGIFIITNMFGHVVWLRRCSNQIVYNQFLLCLGIKDFKLLQYVNAVQVTAQEDIISCV